MDTQELKEIIERHQLWLNGKLGGERAYLSNANLRGANLRGANLGGANLSDANLIGADLIGADLSGANLSDSDLRGAILRGADLRYADLSNADLSNADLSGANLSGADLSGTIGLPPIACPEKGSFVGFKKALGPDNLEVIVEIQILKNAKRSSATTRKCRCSEAKVLSITTIDGEPMDIVAHSKHDKTFTYKVDEFIKVDDFDDNRWNECAAGIHFFITRNEAVNWNL